MVVKICMMLCEKGECDGLEIDAVEREPFLDLDG